ncbi:hypothetical protein [Paenibacillus apiarius]|uniref:Uncharacterized protein n=1 Tax=Paenibacillus apiarius TaxID=46240 RepID=A0ABT4DY79_9BACL|nr:hypothetical protein [Paenibacillus apiarius]MCY9514882.1 hypothetical protein [Paenibacillus apiarius]MCY9521238.1 hypothetical protein [Paenibacillus apiarius]MCY9560328.1 hypothetical protein [Paenibacillus apiarius]MCY9685678.1 hypothetical protein [Paenibacillus apiarius]MCY9724077.1 hypothetical protein [Paenibacillus apiarius]
MNPCSGLSSGHQAFAQELQRSVHYVNVIVARIERSEYAVLASGMVPSR